MKTIFDLLKSFTNLLIIGVLLIGVSTSCLIGDKETEQSFKNAIDEIG